MDSDGDHLKFSSFFLNVYFSNHLASFVRKDAIGDSVQIQRRTLNVEIMSVCLSVHPAVVIQFHRLRR